MDRSNRLPEGRPATRRALLVLSASTALGISLTGCATRYARLGPDGGYADERIDERTYRVSFQGNKDTASDRVWMFWLYRCAELTVEQKHVAFVMLKDSAAQAPSWLPALAHTDAVWPSAAQGPMLPTRSGRSTPSYIYVPGGTYTVTKYRASGTIRLLREPVAPEIAEYALRASAVIDALRAHVESSGRAAAPGRKELLEAASMKRRI